MSVPTEQTITNYYGTTTKDTKYYYDGLTFGSVNVGNLTQEQDWVSGTHYASTTKTYNSYGLVATSTDADGNATTYSYDANNLYPATTTNALSQTTEYTYDYSNGKVEQKTDPNGLVFKNVYDGLGRLTQVSQPDFTTPSTLDETLYNYVDSTSTTVEQCNLHDLGCSYNVCCR